MSIKRKLTFLAVFTGAAVGTMHIVNRVFQYISTADNLIDKDTYQYYSWRFGKIAYAKSGSGRPILLIHDLNVCSSSCEWHKVINRLSKTNTVYAIDLLGCGCSDRPILTYTNFLYVQLITDFIKDIIGERTDVIASGEASSFAIMACANDSTVIDRVILVNPHDLASQAKIPTKRSYMIKYLLLTPIIGTFIYNMKVNKRTIRESLLSLVYDQNSINEKDILTCFEASHKDNTNSKYLFACQKSRFTNANIVCCLSKINNSIFIITGSANPENIVAANQYQNHLPSIEILGINKTKQLPHLEKPEEFAEQVSVFFSEADGE